MWQAVGGQNPLVFSFRYDIIRKRCQYRFFPGIYSRSWKSGVSAEYPAAIYLSTASAVKADLCNAVIFDGKQIIRPEDLTTLPRHSGVMIADLEKGRRVLQRYRDVCAPIYN